MLIDYLALKSFRNYDSAEFFFNPGLNLLLGLNGQGKTNAVESIMFLATQTSHRTSNNKALIKSDSSDAIIRAKFSRGHRQAIVEAQIKQRGANQYFLNKHATQGRELQRICQAVLFAPEDLLIVRGEPANRRKFIDEALSIRYPDAASVLQEYAKVVKHKSSLLKNLKYGVPSAALLSTLNLWNEKQAELGSQIIFYRQQLVSDLLPHVNKSYDFLAEVHSEAGMSIKESVSRETCGADVSRETIHSTFMDSLEKIRDEEIDKTQSIIGPHRDDLEFTLNQLPVKGYASHGETWSFVLSLKLAVAKLISLESFSGDPIVILDDVFAELDVRRRERLMTEIKNFEQVIVTAAVEEDVSRETPATVYRIRNGAVTLDETNK